MPIYVWHDKKSGETFDIFKDSFDQSSEEPKDDELPEEARGKERDWIKHLGTGVKVTRGASWSGSKGNWSVLIGGLGWLTQVFQDLIL